MKKLILPILLALSLSSYSQYSQHPKVIDTPAELNLPSNRVIRFVESPTLETKPDLRLEEAGKHLEKAGQHRNLSIILMCVTGLVSGSLMWNASESSDLLQPRRSKTQWIKVHKAESAGIIAGVGLVGSLSLNISANIHTEKAGKILQGK